MVIGGGPVATGAQSPPRPAPPSAARRPSNRYVRWIARRPPEAIPPPELPPPPRPPGIPRYRQIPRWGLVDVPDPAPEPPRPRAHANRQVLRNSVIIAMVLLILAAAAEIWVYALLIANRTEPVNRTHAAIAIGINLVVGIASLLAVVAVFATMIAWLREERVDRYRRDDRVDPRGRWQLVVGCVVPVLNLAWPAAFFHELAARYPDNRRTDVQWPMPGDDLEVLSPRCSRILRRWWVGWVAVSVLAYLTVLVRWCADSVQWAANGVWLTAASDLAGAAFLAGTLWVLNRLFTERAVEVPATRWLAVA
ncbi:DUF4328 domain-containing protein [Williamsia sterculiae]|nr:DUF4328 domain-containing protein [Williamsia sterculiae]